MIWMAKDELVDVLGEPDSGEFIGSVGGVQEGIEALGWGGQGEWVSVNCIAKEICQGVGVGGAVGYDVVVVLDEQPIGVGIAVCVGGEDGWGCSGCGGDGFGVLEDRRAVVDEPDIVSPEFEDVANGEGSLEA